MRYSARKKWVEEPPLEQVRMCDHPACSRQGEYRAPRSRDTLDSYFWFCLDHVRAYNAEWDYYAGLSSAEIEAMIRADVHWQRPSWPLGRLGGGHRVDIGRVRDPFGLFDDAFAEAPRRPVRPPSPEEEAMRVLELQPPLTLVSLKARYKELVKRHHPDANNGDKAAEERFKAISQAYRTLIDSLAP